VAPNQQANRHFFFKQEMRIISTAKREKCLSHIQIVGKMLGQNEVQETENVQVTSITITRYTDEQSPILMTLFPCILCNVLIFKFSVTVTI
jgi:hypothetical protein